MGPFRYGGILWLNQLEKWTIETIYGVFCFNQVWAFSGTVQLIPSYYTPFHHHFKLLITLIISWEKNRNRQEVFNVQDVQLSVTFGFFN